MFPNDWLIRSGLILVRTELSQNSGERAGVIFCFVLEVRNIFCTKVIA